jgi:hypothetical protein
MLLGAGWPLNISAGPYRKAVQQQEQLTITGCCDAGSALSGSAYSVCGSTARQVIVRPHFLHFTTQAWGSIPFPTTIIGEQKENTVHVAEEYPRDTKIRIAPRAPGQAIRNSGTQLAHSLLINTAY